MKINSTPQLYQFFPQFMQGKLLDPSKYYKLIDKKINFIKVDSSKRAEETVEKIISCIKKYEARRL